MYCWLIINCCTCIKYLAIFITVLNSSFCQFIEYQDAHANLLPKSTVTLKSCAILLLLGKNCLLVNLLTLFFVLCLFVVLVDYQVRFEGKALVLITPIPDYCYFFSYSQTPCAILLVYILDKFCICSLMLRIFWSLHAVLSKLIPQSSSMQFKQSLSDLIVLG